MSEGLQPFINGLWDCLFPFFCIQCNVRDTYFCPACRTGSWFAQPGGVRVTPIDGQVSVVNSLSTYTAHPVIERLLEDYKYGSITKAQLVVSDWMRNAPWLIEKIGECHALVPVPLHPRRLAERGFNQAEHIARILGEMCAIPVITDALIRIRATKQQATLTRKERIINVQNAFVCIKPQKVAGKNIILVDDVYTTGSTLRACATSLHNAATASISGFTLVHG
jgi:ComF family protein